MQYTIKGLNNEWITKTLVYEVIKNSFPISNTMIKNVRYFNENDLEIFKHYKQFWFENTAEKYWFKNSKQTVWNSLNENEKQFLNSPEELNDLIKKAVSVEIETVSKQFELKEKQFLNTILEKENIIKIKGEQTQKYALLKVEQEKEKKEWIQKYEKVTQEKEILLNKFYLTKSYMLVFAVLLAISVVFTFLFASSILKF